MSCVLPHRKCAVISLEDSSEKDLRFNIPLEITIIPDRKKIRVVTNKDHTKTILGYVHQFVARYDLTPVFISAIILLYAPFKFTKLRNIFRLINKRTSFSFALHPNIRQMLFRDVSA